MTAAVLLVGCSEDESATSWTRVPPDGLEIGDAAVTADGNQVTMHAFEDDVPAPDEYAAPERGNRFALVDVELCAAVDRDPDESGAVLTFEDVDYRLELDDGSRIYSTYKQPRSPAAPTWADIMSVGDCLRGWMTFEVSKGRTAVAVLDVGERPQIEWTIS